MKKQATFLMLAMGAGAIFSLGRLTAPGAILPSAVPTAQLAQPSPTSNLRSSEVQRRKPPAFQSSAAASSDCKSVDPQVVDAQAGRFFDQLFARLDRAPATLPPEARANSSREYLVGAIAAMRTSEAPMREGLARQLTSHLCGTDLPAERSLLLADLSFEMPEIASEQGFGCFFARSAGREDIQTWHMLDAFNSSGFEAPAALKQLASSAQDPRTKRRLMTREEQQKLRSARPALATESSPSR